MIHKKCYIKDCPDLIYSYFEKLTQTLFTRNAGLVLFVAKTKVCSRIPRKCKVSYCTTHSFLIMAKAALSHPNCVASGF